MALVVSRAHVLVELAKSDAALNEVRAEALGELEAAAYRIKLRENPVKPEWTEVIEGVEEIRSVVREPHGSVASLSSLSERIVPSARCRLKTEWNLVRDGETSYRLASHRYWMCVGVLISVAAIVLSVGAYNAGAPSAPGQATSRAVLDARCSAGCDFTLR